MASLFKRKQSPFWWIKHRDTNPGSATLGKTIRSSTGLRVGVGADTRRARQLCAEHSLAETKFSTSSPKEQWVGWAADFLKVHCKSPATLTRYLTIWRNVSLFLVEKDVQIPRQLTRTKCLEYFEWRTKVDRSAGKYKACHNTAHTELKVLSLVMSEAVRREFAPFNPVKELGVKRHAGKQKPEFTMEHLETIQKAIDLEPEPLRTFLANSFIIARYQGCRLNETWLNPLTAVDISADGTGLIRFLIKGGREHTAPLHAKLVPLFKRLKELGRDQTYVRPPNPSRTWFDFLKRIGIRKLLPGACFHSLRVTAVTRLARSPKVSEAKAMRYIGHASTTVHRIYQRLRTEDLGDCLKALD